MKNEGSYSGKELSLFSQATGWKKYFSSFLLPYIVGDVLETGAGPGNTTAFLQRSQGIRSWTFLEPDPAFCQVLRENMLIPSSISQKIIEGTILSTPEKEDFDTIIYIDVLEHIENDAAELEQATKRLRSGGNLIILSPAHPFLYSPFDKSIGHYRRYNKKSLQDTMACSSLKPVKVFYLDSLGVLLSLGNKILARQSYPTAKQIRFWDRYVIGLSRILDRIVFHSIGKTIIGIWNKS